MKKNVMPYDELIQQEQQAEEFQPKKLGLMIRRIIKKGILTNAIGFLLGRASILGGITPFGVAFYAAMSGVKVNMFMLFISINIGILTTGITLTQIKYIIAITMYSLMNIFTPIDSKKNLNSALRLSFCIFFIGNLFIFYKGFLMYDFILNTFEALLVLMFVLLLRNTTWLFQVKEDLNNISNEELISVSILSILALIGVSDVTIWQISIRNVMIISAIILFSYKNGAGVGATLGLIAGTLVSMSGDASAAIIGVYGICGLISGALRNVGKIGSIIGFLFANSIATIYANGSTEILISIFDILAAGVVVGIISDKKIAEISNYFLDSQVNIIKRAQYEKIKNVTNQKLMEFSDSFYELAKTFNKIAEKNTRINKEDIATLFEEVAENVCKDCSLNTVCWQKDYYNTYQAICSILERAEINGHIQRNDVEPYMKERCIRIEEFIDNTNEMYELFKANSIWQKRLVETRDVISQQYEGISQVILQLAQDVDSEIVFKTDIERKIQLELSRIDFEVDEIMVIKNKNNRYEVTIAHKPCGNQRKCFTNIIPIVSKVLGRNLVKDDILCNVKNDNQICIVKLVEQYSYKVTTGVAAASKKRTEICGDSYKFIELSDGKFAVALSDGMGSGSYAAKDSKAVLDVLEKFLKSGFDKDLSIKLINSILILKSTTEAFSTIDLSIVDLFSAQVEFAKIGAATTFVKKLNKVEMIKSTSLPVGILKNVDIEVYQKSLDDGDILIMLTDGILDANKDVVNKEEWIKEEIRKISSKNPQEIADKILQMSNQFNNAESLDDRTVLVAKISEVV